MHKKLTSEEFIQLYTSIIDKHYGDILSAYSFRPQLSDVARIVYENDCFTLEFGFEFNQWGYMLYLGIAIGVKKTQKVYWLGYVVRAFMNDDAYDFEKAAETCIAQSSRGMTDFEAHRIQWTPYVVDTFKDCEPTWENAIAAFGRRMGTVW